PPGEDPPCGRGPSRDRALAAGWPVTSGSSPRHLAFIFAAYLSGDVQSGGSEMRATALRAMVVAAAAVMLAAGFAGSATAKVTIATPKASHFGRHSDLIDNVWFPLAKGSVWVYDGQKDGKQARDVMTVTPKVKLIAGIRAAVVHDRLFLNGQLAERTTDFYAQDKRGTVWYLGENTAELNASGKVTSTEGSFQHGRD